MCKLPRKAPQVRKMYFDTDIPSGTSRDQLLNDCSLTLIRYIGEENVVVNFARRKAMKHKDVPFVLTCPSDIQQFKEMCKSSCASVVYKKETASMNCDPALVKAQTQCNMNLLWNLSYQHLPQHLPQSCISHEMTCGRYPPTQTLYTSLATKKYWKKQTSHFFCTMVHNSSHDTTCQLRDYYVSPLIFRHTPFREKLCIPTMFLFHERKFVDTHKQMFLECVLRIPALKDCRCPLVTDKGKGIVNAVKEVLPSISQFFLFLEQHFQGHSLLAS